ncbi:DUF1778 domain-containing protein [Pseudomonas rhodesiae]|uniref:type II toxin-antitoxin system TacA family antitoxin n=1 Tax=Pseudomonas rhodesiae TaxID=76760 RepID=UPI00058F1665|nr:DUF1778 domain-containing protein [Pseudomonas rhodesiae]
MTTLRKSRGPRISLRITEQQQSVLRRAAKLADTSLANFIVDSAYQVAKQTLLDGRQAQAFLEMLDRPARNNPGLNDLLGRPAPWSN